MNNLLSLISRENLKEYNEKVASWVRITSTQEEVESLNYIKSVLDSFGYQTTMPFYDGYISYPKKACVTIEGNKAKAFKGISSCFTPSTSIGGIVAEAADWNENNFCGKIVLIDGLANANKLKTAYEKGAVAVLFVHDDNIHNGPASDIWGNPTVKDLDLLPKIPAVCISRPSGTSIRERMKSGKTILRVESTVFNEWSKCPLLIAEIKATNTDKFVFFTGHIDSWDYGAMDNGSANAIMMECARILALKKNELKRGIRLAFWSGHSQGKYAGSSWYVDNHFEEIQDNCVAYVNIDSTGGIGSTVIEEPPVMGQAWDFAKEIFEKQLPEIKFNGKRMARNADQSFFGLGITSLFGTFSEQDKTTVGNSLSFRYGENSKAGGLGWWWHTDKDTMDKIDPALEFRDCKLYLEVLYRLLIDTVLPFSLEKGLVEIQNTVNQLAEKLSDNFDFSKMQNRISNCMKKAKVFDTLCLNCKDEEAEKLLSLQQELFRNLVLITYRENDEYHFDICGELYTIPSLKAGEDLACSMEGSSRYYLYKVELQKGYNRVMHYLREIEKLI